jgi:hypothetical protein
MLLVDEDMTLEGVGTGVAPARTRRRRGSRAGLALGWLGARLRTTPGRLVLVSVLVVAGAVVFGIVAAGAEQSRERAVRAARTSTEPLLVHAVKLYTALSEANATVATGLLRGGLERPSSRILYKHDLQVATSALTALTRGAGTLRAQADLGTIADDLPTYTGYVEAARANARHGYPISAAYMRTADGLLKSSMLPAAERVYRAEAERLNSDYQTGTDNATLVALVAAIAVALVLLLLAQGYVKRISHRIFNLPMLIATVAFAGVSVWAVIGLTSEQNSLASAQRKGSDSLEARSVANVLLSRAQRDLSLALVSRGTDQTDPLDFRAVTGVLTTSPIAGPLRSRFASYRAAGDGVQHLEDQGQLETAINDLRPVAAMSQQLSDELGAQITASDARFKHTAGDAASDLSGLGLAIPLVTVLVAVVSVLGLRQRINEYR